MNRNSKKTVIAMSGGIDSSVAAALLIERGYDCSGVFMITNEQASTSRGHAEKIAEKLGIKLQIVDYRKEFEQILNYFSGEYEQGRTPNPCVYCNRHIKFGRLLQFARGLGADYLATGHYARILSHQGQIGLYESVKIFKDQSYFLAMIKRDVLGHILFPMGDYQKEQTYEMAAKFGLMIEQRKESQEICFIPDDDYIKVLETRCPQLVRKGKIVDSSGNILGEHNGTHRFTIGQRRGLRVAMGRPYYVTKIDAGTNTVTLGPKEEVMRRKLIAKKINWLVEMPSTSFKARIKIRYNSPGFNGLVSQIEDGLEIEFAEPISAITAGQLAVFYIEDAMGSKVAGSGWIEAVSD